MSLYWVSRNLLWLFLKLFCKFQVYGQDNIPKTGGIILAPNHVSYMDPPATGAACPRQVHFMAKEELFKIPLLGSWVQGVESFSVKRGTADRQALHRAVEHLKKGDCVCVFPEGKRVRPGEHKEPEPGVTLLASMAGVSIVPVAIVGTQPLFRKVLGIIPWYSRISVRFGKPVELRFDDPSKKRSEVLQETARLVMTQVYELKQIQSCV